MVNLFDNCKTKEEADRVLCDLNMQADREYQFKMAVLQQRIKEKKKSWWRKIFE